MSRSAGLLGNAIKEARVRKKLTQEQLAEAVGITAAHLKQVESERRNPSVDLLFKLVQTIDLSLDSVFSQNNDSTLELRNRISLSLDQCDVHELEVAYATIEALRKKGS